MFCIIVIITTIINTYAMQAGRADQKLYWLLGHGPTIYCLWTWQPSRTVCNVENNKH